MLKKKAIIFWGILIILFQFPVTVYASQNVDRGVDYIKGRPLTEAEIQAQREMEPELKELTPYNIPESESSAAPRARMALPTAYDSRNSGYITSVKDQNPWGACWAFAFQGTLEASLIKDGWSAGVDLSEQHLGYFTYYRTADLFGNTAGDQVQIYLRQNVDKGYLDFGGNAQWAVMAMSSWTGAADESVSVYPRNTASIRPLNNAVAYQDKVHLQNAKWVGTKDRTTMKQWILNYGASYISMVYEAPFFNRNTAAYNYQGYGNMNHAVTLVGWNDTYSKDNFPEGCKPINNGAWLAKNSYGSAWGDRGYFWISYEDNYLNRSDSYAFVMEGEAADNYDHIYQYDGTIYDGYVRIQNGYSAGNIYQTASANANGEILEAVSFMSETPNLSYKIQIYRNVRDQTNPASGVPVFTSEQTGNVSYSGYYTIPLNEKVHLDKGERFSVVITFTNRSGTNVLLHIDKSDTSYSDMHITNHTEAGQSFVGNKNGNVWYDGDQQGYSVRMKAFTSKAAVPNPRPRVTLLERININKTNLTINKNGTSTLRVSYSPEDTTVDKRVTWTSKDSKIAAVDKNGKVLGLRAGSTVITARVGNLTAKCKVTVKSPLNRIALTKQKLTLTPKMTSKIKVIFYPSDTTDSRKITWSSSNKKVATVKNGVITAAGVGEAEIKAKVGKKKSAVCKVSVKKPKVSLNRSSTVLYTGGKTSVILKADIRGASNKISWSSSDSRIAKVDKKGKVTAVRKGTAFITATANKVKKTCKITVREPSLKLRHTAVNLKKNKTYAIKANAVPKGKITYKSERPKVASVNRKGIVTGLRQGNTNITVKCNGIKRVIKITVK